MADLHEQIFLFIICLVNMHLAGYILLTCIFIKDIFKLMPLE